ncbi:MAG: hypothetical protein ABI977_28200 [Acidobacteriota bacterium]
MNDESQNIVIELSNAEALVLFEFLSRFEDTKKITVEDQAEERVLWDVQCLLEKQLTEPFSPNYVELVMAARDRVRDSEE